MYGTFHGLGANYLVSSLALGGGEKGDNFISLMWKSSQH